MIQAAEQRFMTALIYALQIIGIWIGGLSFVSQAHELNTLSLLYLWISPGRVFQAKTFWSRPSPV